MMLFDSSCMIVNILLMKLTRGDCSFLSKGVRIAKNASIEGKPGIVHPTKLLIALSISFNFNSFVN